MTSSRASLPLAALLLLPLACTTNPAASSAKTGDEAEAKPSEAKPSEAKPSEEKPVDSKELTAEELTLIDSDPKTLGPEENRKRAYALRKRIMQNPDSPQAKALDEAREAALAGQLGVPGQDPKDNGVVIPAPDHLKNQDQSWGKPAE